MANVPRARLEAVREVLPGLSGPTVIELYGGGPLVAVHAVVSEASLYRTVAALKALGGEGILVTRIERLLP
jgi:ATP phosphoribosyltransferase